MRRAVLMGDPMAFRIKAGANPHTRTRWGCKKRVNLARAIEQWNRMRATLIELGVHVLVMPPVPDSPGTVFPANAGFLTRKYEQVPISEKTFYLSNLLPARMGEMTHYQLHLEPLGIRTAPFPKVQLGTSSTPIEVRFEGEADFFPWADGYLLTFGPLERQRWALGIGWPLYRRIYGFRSDQRCLEPLQAIVGREHEVIPLQLVKDTHYHGDTVLSAFGPKREFLLAYLAGLGLKAQERIRMAAQDRLIELGEADGEACAANSLQVDTEQGLFLVMPAGTSDALQQQVRERGVTPIAVDVSEFFATGGGSVKCLVLDLGYL